MPPESALASVSVDRIATAFIAWAEAEPGRYWWWPRDIRLDPDEVIADDGEGGTYRVPFTTDGELDITFGDPVEVRETFVDVAAPAAAAAAASARVRQRVLARDLPKPTKPDPSNPAASRPQPQEGTMPTITSEQFRALRDLPEDATEEQIQQVMAADPDPQPDPQPQPDPAQPDPTTAPEPAPSPEPTPPPAPEPAPAPQPTAAEPDPIAATQARELQETSQRVATLEAQARQREETETRQRRDGLATRWVTEGRIPPAEREHYRQLLDVDEERTVALASSLAVGRIPVRERGYDDPAAATGGDGITSTGWFPQLASKES